MYLSLYRVLYDKCRRFAPVFSISSLPHPLNNWQFTSSGDWCSFCKIYERSSTKCKLEPRLCCYHHDISFYYQENGWFDVWFKLLITMCWPESLGPLKIRRRGRALGLISVMILEPHLDLLEVTGKWPWNESNVKSVSHVGY